MFPSVEIADYIHKVGRTGRAGKKGKASLFATPAELPYVLLLKRKRKVKFQEVIQSEKLNSSNIIDQIESLWIQQRNFSHNGWLFTTVAKCSSS